MYKINCKLFFLSILAICLIINCSTPHTNEEKKDDIVVNDIVINEVSNKVPVENTNQIDLELLAIVNEENYKQDINYKWYIEYLKLDIENKSTTINTSNINQTKEDILIDRFLEGYYFIEVSKKNPLNALLSIYQDGFYKISLKAINNNNISEFSVVVKVGEPILPNLYVKVNIPKMDKLSRNNYEGKLYLSIFSNEGLEKSDIIELNANEMMDDWFDTGIIINPFQSFKIKAGTHILDDSIQNISSILNNNDSYEYDSIGYSLNNEELKFINLNPLIIKGYNNKNLVITKTGSKLWFKGNLYISFLMWKDDNSDYDKFIYFIKELNTSNTEISANLIGIYLSKIFIGSFGHRVPFNNYYIYFGPEGINLEELDPKNRREYPGLPYGFLLGKLGENGTVFPISYEYIYETKQILKVLSF